MAHKLTVGISVNFLSDGASNTLVLDLSTDPYRLDPPNEVNWPDLSKRPVLPTAVSVEALNWGATSGGQATGSATISGSVVTFTFTGVPPAGLQSFPAHLIF